VRRDVTNELGNHEFYMKLLFMCARGLTTS